MLENEIYFDHEDREGMQKAIRHRKKKLYAAIKQRMEFYFSDANLQKDRYLSQLIQDDPQVDLSIFLRFNRIQQLTTSLRDLQKALKSSEILQLTEDKNKIFRTTPLVEKENIDACTIYVEQLSPDADHDWLTEVFSKYGKVDYVSIPKYKNSGKVKGFAFVEFANQESAKSALEDFEKEGCCLTSHMSPDQLCSIATFEEDKIEPNASAEQNHSQNTKTEEKDSEHHKGEKKAKKRKNSEIEQSKDSEESPVADKKIKKIESAEVKKDDPEAQQTTDPESADDNIEGSTVSTKKKKNRKKKKSHKTKYINDIKSYGLQILSKTDWKRLRNKYLNLQKEKMKRLKQHIHKSQMNQYHRQQQHQPLPQESQPISKPRFEFTPGLIVKVSFEEPLFNTKVAQFKSEAKSLENVKYVDAREGEKEAFIRFGDSNSVSEIFQSNSQPWENMLLLEGEEEKHYWEKMLDDRKEKFENRKKINKKGRKKLINRAEKLISKKIRLSVDE